MYYVYLLKSKKDRRLYIGFTNNPRRRLEQHNHGDVTSTRPRIPFEIIYLEGYKSESDARRREKNLKLFSKAYYSLRKRLLDSL